MKSHFATLFSIIEMVKIVIKRWFTWVLFNLELVKRWNWKAIIVCFFTATTFWVFHSLNSDHTATIKLPFEVVFEGENIIPLQSPPEQISVNVSGYGWNLLSKSLGFGMEPIYVEINDPTKSTYISPRSLLSLVTDRFKDLKVNFIAEDSIRFNYDTLISKTIILKVDSSNIKTSDGFRKTTAVELNQDTITIRGAATLVRDYIDTLIINPEILGVKDDVKKEIDIPLVSNRFVSINPSKIIVSFQVRQFFRKTQMLELREKNFPADSSVYIKKATVFLDYTIREDQLNSQPDSLIAVIDYHLVDWRDSTIIPNIKLPAIFEDTLMVPPKLKLAFRKK